MPAPVIPLENFGPPLRARSTAVNMARVAPASDRVFILALRRSCISRVRWNVRQEPSQALGYRQMRDDGVAKPRVWQVRQHRGLHCCHDLARLGADHCESENTIVTTNENFHKSLYFIGRVRPQDTAHR